MIYVTLAVIATIMLLPNFRNWVAAIVAQVADYYITGVVISAVIGFIILIAVVAGAPVWFIAILGFPEAILIALLLWIRAITADVEAEIRSYELPGWARRKFQQEQIRRAKEIADASRQWAVLLIVVVFLYATSPRWLPVVNNSPIAHFYVVSQYKTSALKEQADRQFQSQAIWTKAHKQVETDMLKAAVSAYLNGTNELSQSSRRLGE